MPAVRGANGRFISTGISVSSSNRVIGNKGFGVTVSIDEQEMKRLERMLAKLPVAVARRLNRRAAASAMTPTLKAAKAKCPVETGALKKSLGRKQKTYARSGVSVVLIGPRVGFKTESGRNPVNYAHLKEKGTRYVRAEPFLRPALDENRAAMVSIYRESMAAGIERESKK